MLKLVAPQVRNPDEPLLKRYTPKLGAALELQNAPLSIYVFCFADFLAIPAKLPILGPLGGAGAIVKDCGYGRRSIRTISYCGLWVYGGKQAGDVGFAAD